LTSLRPISNINHCAVGVTPSSHDHNLSRFSRDNGHGNDCV
jgi:hypothetical protein